MSVARNRWWRFSIMTLVVVVSIPAVIVIRTVSLDRCVTCLKEERYECARLFALPFAYAGDHTAQLLLGYALAAVPGNADDRSRAVRWFRRADKSTVGNAHQVAANLFAIAENYANGTQGMRKDSREAVEWLKLAADEGSASACEELSRAYAEGRLGLSRDDAQAAFWRRRAAGARYAR